MGFKSRVYRACFPAAFAAGRIRAFPKASGILLMYHEVLPDEVELPAWTVVRESDFRWQMMYLQAHFDVVSMERALVRLSGPEPSERPFAVVTFDDGYRGNLVTVLPIMKSLGLPFLVYVAVQKVMEGGLYWYDQVIRLLGGGQSITVELESGSQIIPMHIPGSEVPSARRWTAMEQLLRRLKQMSPEERSQNVARIVLDSLEGNSVPAMLNESELRELAAADLVTIGSHTYGHELLDQISSEAVSETLRVADLHIERMVGYAAEHFAYPNGNYNSAVLAQVQKFGYRTAVTTKPGLWSAKTPHLEIPRISIGRFETEPLFKARVSGALW